MDSKFENVKAIFFDTSDTLYKSDALEAAYPQKLVELIAATKGLSTSDAKQQLNEATERLKATEKHVTKVRAAAEFGLSRQEVHDKAFCTVNPHDFLTPDKQLDELMARLAQHYKLGIISNLRHSHMLEVFDALGLSADWLPLMVTEDTVTNIKPDHEPFLKAIELASCQPQECLFVGDSPTKDMRPAKEVGMQTILIAESPTEEDMKFADASVGDVKQLESVLA
jgi:HAD superfamily hydrolase (TIGR01549 family)